eukprot:scaffold159467_cov53-Prasinocladus_malaysianus.AAC.1
MQATQVEVQGGLYRYCQSCMGLQPLRHFRGTNRSCSSEQQLSSARLLDEMDNIPDSPLHSSGVSSSHAYQPGRMNLHSSSLQWYNALAASTPYFGVLEGEFSRRKLQDSIYSMDRYQPRESEDSISSVTCNFLGSGLSTLRRWATRPAAIENHADGMSARRLQHLMSLGGQSGQLHHQSRRIDTVNDDDRIESINHTSSSAAALYRQFRQEFQALPPTYRAGVRDAKPTLSELLSQHSPY